MVRPLERNEILPCLVSGRNKGGTAYPCLASHVDYRSTLYENTVTQRSRTTETDHHLGGNAVGPSLVKAAAKGEKSVFVSFRQVPKGGIGRDLYHIGSTTFCQTHNPLLDLTIASKQMISVTRHRLKELYKIVSIGWRTRCFL